VLENPMHVRFISTGEADMRPAMSNPRVLVVLDDASQATIVESYVGPKGVQYFTNAVTEIVLGENAALDHYKLQCESMESYHTAVTHVVAASGANCSAHSVTLGGAFVRDDVVAVLGGDGVQCTLSGFCMVDGDRLVDNHTTIEHVMRRCKSRQIYNGILADQARGVFDGKIMVGADAHATDAKQTNRTLLLSEDARINATSHRESLAKQVHCTQRAVSQQIDEAAAFYIRRGLGDAEARRRVILAFVRDMLNRLPLQPLARGVEEVLRRQLEPMLGSVV
jgi:Fe-S cluster assembly protein SufD